MPLRAQQRRRPSLQPPSLQWEQLNRQWQSFGQQEQAFDNIINGVDLVEDPSTGQEFEAPYDAYSPDGPDGPGYYTQSGQRLTVVNQSG